MNDYEDDANSNLKDLAFNYWVSNFAQNSQFKKNSPEIDEDLESEEEDPDKIVNVMMQGMGSKAKQKMGAHQTEDQDPYFKVDQQEDDAADDRMSESLSPKQPAAQGQALTSLEDNPLFKGMLSADKAKPGGGRGPLGRDSGGEEEEGLDPKYVKEAKRSAFSKMFVPTPLSQKTKKDGDDTVRNRGFGDKLKGFFSGLGHFGLWAGTSPLTALFNTAYRTKKTYHRWRGRRNAEKAKEADQAGNRAAFKKFTLKSGAHRRDADLARMDQMQTGRWASGYDWRKRLGRGFLTKAEKAAHARWGEGSEDWRTARDELESVDAERQPGGRFNREKMEKTKAALASQAAEAKARRRGADASQIAQMQAQSQAAVQQAAQADQKLPSKLRATQRQSNINAQQQDLNVDIDPKMDVIPEGNEEEEEVKEPQWQQPMYVQNQLANAGRDSAVDENGQLILPDEYDDDEEY